MTIESDYKKPSCGFGRQQPIITTSFNDKNIPVNPFNEMMPISPAPLTEQHKQLPKIDDIATQQQVFNISHMSTLSKAFSSVNASETSSDVGTFYSEAPKRISPASNPSTTPSPPKSHKRKLSMGKSFL